MDSEKLIIVDSNDKCIGEDTKKVAHTFNTENPQGLLHRAFSVFLFNSQGKLLLQQRASNKITFPNVWSNTCCSHPIIGCSPSEYDSESDIAAGYVNGIKNAAIRKLKHELGIDLKLIPTSSIKYLTRLHYCAADKDTYGEKSPWGEHEIDYILFIRADVDYEANPEEVRDTKYVTYTELKHMLATSSGLLWSPWFRVIADKLLANWWSDLDTTMTTDKFVNYDTIYRF